MRCKKCGHKAVLKMPRHNTSVCKACLEDYFLDAVRRAIEKEKMFGREDRILVAVSGGKDSLALWDALLRLGYDTEGFHVALGIGEYSVRSTRAALAFAESRGRTLEIYDIPKEHGGGITEIASESHRSPCSACGTIKRYQFNEAAIRGGFSVVATGHNLDDEAARLLGNVLHWQMDYLAKQSPVLPAEPPHFVRKVKPLYRVAEQEVAAYALVRGIDYVVEECPNAKGSKLLAYKEALNRLEADAPGTKQGFYYAFLKEAAPGSAAPSPQLTLCERCGRPTTAPVCGYCRLVAKVELQQ